MKIRHICIAALLFLFITPTLRAQSFNALWKQVAQADEKGLPQTAIRLTSEIYRKAENEKNSPQMLKAYTWRTKYQDRLTPDSFQVSLQGLKQWAQTTEHLVERAVLHSLIAGAYADYVAQYRWTLRHRTDIVDETPSADIREWSSNQLLQQVLIHTRESLKNKDLLGETSTRTYTPFVELGNGSEYYRHDMYHLLSSRSIDALKSIRGIGSDSIVHQSIEGVFRQMMATYQKPGFEEASVLVMLNYLTWRRESDPTFVSYRAPKGLMGLTQDPYLAELNKLMATYSSHDICAEVYLAKARYAISNNQEEIALQLCSEAIRLYPKYKRIAALKNDKQLILNPHLSVDTPQRAYPGGKLSLRVSHKNLDGFIVSIHRVALSERPKGNKDIDDAFYRNHCKKVTEEHLTLNRPTDYQQKDTTFLLDAPIEGLYVMQIKPDSKAVKPVAHFFHVTRFKVLTRLLPNNQYEVVTLDGATGKPIVDATVLLYAADNRLLNQLTTDATGKVSLSWKSEYRLLKAQKGTDQAMALETIYKGSYNYHPTHSSVNEVKLLTDRSLYRPGQTVYVKGIAYQQQSDTANVVAYRNYTLTLLDANNQEVAKRELQTNDFGSFTTNFTLPTACLNGDFTLSTAEGEARIRVEEYKRPTFDITFDKLNSSYRLGDRVEVKGRVQTFSGVSLQDLPMQYTVTRTERFGWRNNRAAQAPLVSATVTLNENGEFTLPVLLEGEESHEEVYYTFHIDASVTHVAGETQRASFSIAAGTRSLLLSPGLADRICKEDSIQTVFTATNLNGESVAVKGTAQLYPLVHGKRSMTDDKPVYTETFTKNQRMLLDAWKALPSGEYQLVLTVQDEQGREVTSQTNIVLFSTKDTRPVVDSSVWYYEVNTSFDANHPAVFYFGTSKKDVYVMMDIFSGDQWLESKSLTLSDSIVRFEYPYQATYGKGLLITYCFVKEGEVLESAVRLHKRLPDKTLTMKWDVFRDKLRPGQQEEWKLTIRTPQSTPAVAEVLATMYDASLDHIWRQTQGLSLHYPQPFLNVNWMHRYDRFNSYYYSFSSKSFSTLSLTYDRFTQGSPFGLNKEEVMVTGFGSAKRKSITSPVAMASNDMMQESTRSAGTLAESLIEDSSSKELLQPMAELRTHFAETAFFYPQLRTNEQGEVSFSFTMPQSLTRWNFRGYAHTQGMLTGMLDGEATTSKEFMLTPNLPRFVRVGDQTSVAASLVNLTAKHLKGTVSFTLFDPLTEKIITTQKQPFKVEAGKTIGVSYEFTVSDKYDVLGCRMVADGGTFSDGEQQLIPVLSNKMNLTQAVVMPIRGEETRTFSLDNLFNQHSPSATDRRLTVEFTGNPAWYAVQALPTLGQPTHDNAISWAAMYYAHTLASYILHSQPRIKAVFDSWKQQGGTKETFLSNLQKNQEVKNIILSESPWVVEAHTEQQQQERIATLFDLNNIRNSNLTALTRLKELQLSDGSWAWYKGMNGMLTLTHFIVETQARLALLTGAPLESQAQTMQQSAFVYLHQAALNEYKMLHKAEQAGEKVTTLSPALLKYLYLLSITGEKVPAANEAAYRYLLTKLETLLPSANMSNKAMAAIILHKTGQTQKANLFMASLKEHLVQLSEQRMQTPAHVYVIEAFDIVTKDAAVVEELKVWLLKQKQTQQWDSPVSTVNAVYALLHRGSNLLANQGDVRIAIGGQVMETVTTHQGGTVGTSVAGLGYIKKSFTDKKVVDARQVTVQKRDAGMAWGAVYAQYMEDISQVKQQGGDLHVEKKLYVERLVNNVRQLQPVTAQTPLAIGDKVVSRLHIRLDRPMEFVQLKDQRAACFEPIGNLSGYRWQSGIGCYVDLKDASTHFFFDELSKGVFVLEYSYRVARAGTYELGLATIQSAYAPEFVSHSASMKVTVAQP